jgi:hypothetical protein
MSFDPRQREWLTAMGYTLYRPAGAAAPAGSAPAAPPPEGPLLQALRRAARRDDLSGLPLPEWDRLRGDAAAKRALWRRLRAFRRPH